MRRSTLAVVAALVWAVAAVVPVAAVAPIQQDVDRSGNAVLTDVCAFPITVEFTQTGTDTLFFDQSGALIRIQGHIVEQDVFTANGKTLHGLPYKFNVTVLFDQQTGEVAHVYAKGLISRVPLPGGGVFLTAGRLDFLAHPGPAFLVQPDVGALGNVAGFCVALAP